MGADLGIGAGVSGLHFDVFNAFETLSFGHGGGVVGCGGGGGPEKSFDGAGGRVTVERTCRQSPIQR